MSLNQTAENLLNNSFISRLPLSYKYKQILAFTLAEVLITLLVIGIVASLVIPALINDIQDAELKTAYKKAFASASLAMKTAYSESENLIYYKDRWNSLVSRFNVVKTCTGNTFGNCLPNGGIIPDSSLPNNGCRNIAVSRQASTKAVITSDGMVWFKEYSDSSTNDTFVVGVDVNGLKSPNQWGKDAFLFFVSSKGRIIPSVCDLTGHSVSYLMN